MSDLKITELTANTTPATSDLLAIVDDPAGTPATQKVTIANIAALVLSSLKASGAEVTTGTSEILIATPKSIGDAGVNTRLKSKVVALTRDMTATSGDVSYTGAGFTPTSIIFLATISGATTVLSLGIGDSTKAGNTIIKASDGNYYASLVAGVIVSSTGVGAYQAASIATYDADGFKLTWTKGGTPGAGTLSVYALCLR